MCPAGSASVNLLPTASQRVAVQPVADGPDRPRIHPGAVLRHAQDNGPAQSTAWGAGQSQAHHQIDAEDGAAGGVSPVPDIGRQ